MTEFSTRQRLLRAEDDFLTAISGGEESLSLYEREWSFLQDSVQRGINLGAINEETLSIAHCVASHISSIADCFLEFHRSQQSLKNSLFDNIDDILKGVTGMHLSQPSTNDTGATQNETRGRSPGSPSTQQDHPLPSFIASAYEWLLNNLHNPYPTSDFKHALAQSHGCSTASVNSWFINTRRRMGWTTLCREHFHNCRADAVDAAYRALIKEDPQRVLPAELVHAFMVMKVTAEGLYSSTFTRSVFAGDLDAVVKDMTEEDKKLGVDEKRREAEHLKQPQIHGGVQTKPRVLAVDCYPSPDRSRTSSPVPGLERSLTDESEDEDVLPPVVAGRKRRSSSVERVDCSSFTMSSRPVKRLRSTAPVACSLTAEGGPPSPPPSVDGAEDSSDNDSPTVTTCIPSPVLPPQTRTNNAVSRKRRLSDADVGGMPKRPRWSTAGPRLHAVSDPFPRPNVESEDCIEEWFSTNFDALFALPPPVDAAEPDSSAAWEVELFSDYSIPQDLRKRISRPPSPPVRDTQNSASTDLVELESLLQSLHNGGFVAPSETINSSSTSLTAQFSESTSCDLSCDLSLPLDLSDSFDWTALLNSTGTFEPTIDPIFQTYTDSQSLPEIDLSVLQLPQVMPMVTSGAPALKQAKLDQLQAMQEAVQRMQKELQSEGVAI